LKELIPSISSTFLAFLATLPWHNVDRCDIHIILGSCILSQINSNDDDEEFKITTRLYRGA